MDVLEGMNESELFVLHGDSMGYFPFPDRERLRIARMVANSSSVGYRANPIMAGFQDFIGLPSFEDDYNTIEELRELVYEDSRTLHCNVMIMDMLVSKHGFKPSSVEGIFPEMNDSELIDYLSKVYKKQHGEDLSEWIKLKAFKYLDFMFLRSRVIPLLLVQNCYLDLDDRCSNYAKDYYKSMINKK